MVGVKAGGEKQKIKINLIKDVKLRSVKLKSVNLVEKQSVDLKDYY
tara:strand:- start:363 stop:500 length:138 start_codon:yes stop_codon:yes gene_type:complete